MSLKAASELYAKSIYKLQDKVIERQITREIKNIKPVVKRALSINEKKGFLVFVKIYRAAMGGGRLFGSIEACGVGPSPMSAFMLNFHKPSITAAKPEGAIALDYSLFGGSHLFWFTMKGGYLFSDVIAGDFAKKIIDSMRD